ncbi:hypothetical protein [Nocardia gamkensis]|uniref:hypothetical protein n=1 Tax=Nocardia gamkensis TaxID=352869 RepID=UPI000A708F99|nr:hypothetical protein [Nocardia gamkensis]NQE69071.1 hypothetical protein [Nocardia gamkensis]
MLVIIGMDPHERSATIEIIDPAAKNLATGRYGTDTTGYGEMLTTAQRFPQRVWAIEGCNGVGRHVTHRLVGDGETVIDVPAKLSAQVRVFCHRQRPQNRPGRRAFRSVDGVGGCRICAGYRRIRSWSRWVCWSIVVTSSARPAPSC